MTYSCDQDFLVFMSFMAGLFIGFLVEKCAACQSDRKSDFTWCRFLFSPCLIGKRIEKSQAILALFALMALRSFISTGKPKQLYLMFVCFLFRFHEIESSLCGW